MLNFSKKQSLILAILSSSNIAITFFIQIVTFNIIGPGDSTDALFLGLTIPTFILSITVTALNNVLVPFFSGKSDAEIMISAGALLLLIGIGSVFLTAFLYLTIDFWLPIVANGYDGFKYDLTKSLTSIQLLVLPLAIIYSIQWAVLNAQKKHIQSELGPVSINFFLLPITIFLVKSYGVWGLAIMYPIRFLLQNLVLQLFMKNYNFKGISKDELKVIWLRLKPIMIGSIYYKSEPIIDRGLLSNSSSGTLSLFYLAQQIFSAFTQIIVKSIVMPNITKMSKMHKQRDHFAFCSIYKRTFIQLIFITFTIIFIGISIGKPMLAYLLSIKGNQSSDSITLYYILILLSGSFAGNVCATLSASAFYSIGNTRIPSYMSMITYTIYIPAKIVCFIFFGVYGLAIIISVYSLLNLSLLVIIFHRYYIKRKVEFYD